MQEMIAYIELVEGRTSVISDDNTCYVTHSLIQDPHLLINQEYGVLHISYESRILLF